MSTAQANQAASDHESALVESAAKTHSRDASFPQIESLLSAPEVTQTFGLIEGRDGAIFLVRAGADVVHARRAKGCLIEPAVGDTVLVAQSECHGSYVLSVLHSADDNPESVVSVEGDLTLKSKSGKVAIVGNEGVSVTSGRQVSVTAPEVVGRTMNATLFADSLSYVGRKLEAQVERVRLIGQALESSFDKVTARMKHSYRTIEQLEQVKANELHVTAESTLNMRAKNTLVTAEKLMKVDGEQIHLG
jgi:hypothetical protein